MKDEEIEKLLENSMKKIDNAEIDSLELMYFTELVKGEKKQLERKQNRQFGMFIVSALFIVAGMIVCVFVNSTVYGVLQFAAIGLFFIIYYTKLKSEAIQ